MYRESYFDGGLFSYIGHVLLATFITVLTFGICAPWGVCIMYNWKVKHTVIVSTLMARLCSYLEIGSNGGSLPSLHLGSMCSG